MSSLQEFRQDIIGSLQGLNASGWDLLSGRVIDGMLPLSKATGLTLWYTCMQSGSGGSGVFAHVRAGENLGKLREGLPRFSCAVDVYFAIDKADSDTLSGIVEAVEAMRHAIDGAILGGTTYAPQAIQMAGRVSVVRYVLDVVGIGCEAMTRWLRNESDIPVLNESDLVIFV